LKLLTLTLHCLLCVQWLLLLHRELLLLNLLLLLANQRLLQNLRGLMLVLCPPTCTCQASAGKARVLGLLLRVERSETCVVTG
jgi:hypothetical protein